MSSKPLVAGLLAAACLAPSLAFATPHALASLDLSSLRLSVVDTDATDNLDASFRQTFLQRNVISCIGPGNVATCQDNAVPPGSYTTDPAGVAYGSDQGHGLAADAFASPGWLAVNLCGDGDSGATGVNATQISDLLFTGAGRFTATVDYAISASGLDGLTWRETLAFVGLVVWPYTGAGFQADAIAVAPGVGSDARSGTLSLSFDFTDGQGYVFLPHVHAHTLASTIAAPVPEPATLALMFAGLGIVGATARRRRG